MNEQMSIKILLEFELRTKDFSKSLLLGRSLATAPGALPLIGHQYFFYGFFTPRVEKVLWMYDEKEKLQALGVGLESLEVEPAYYDFWLHGYFDVGFTILKEKTIQTPEPVGGVLF